LKNKNKLLAEAAHRKAEVEADLHRLQLEQEAEAASREADIYQAAAEWEDHQPLDLGDENRAQRTREYVRNTPVQRAPKPFLGTRQTHGEPSHPLQTTALLHPSQP
jgi:peptidoglycan hydrolase CwlO-like protein